MALTTPAIVGPRAAERSVHDQLTRGGTDWAGRTFLLLLVGSLAFSVLVLAVLIIDVLSTGLPVLLERFADFMTGTLRTRADEAGISQGIVGSFWICVFVVVLAFPLGIGAAVYLEEYAPDTRFSRFVNVNIRNLAGVPSIVYGILGFTIFTKALRDLTGSGTANGRTVMSAGLTLAILVLPIVIITASEAVRAVPNALREAGYGVGATRWEVIRAHVLPYAAPGIITGLILSLARALGEAAPLILVGATTGRLAERSVPVRPQPAPGAVHRPAHRGHRVDQEPAGGVRRDRRRRHHRDAGDRDHRQHRRDPPAQPLREEEDLSDVHPRPHGARHSGRERQRHPRRPGRGRTRAGRPRSSSTSPTSASTTATSGPCAT